MFQAQGTRLRLTKGDYGIPLSIHLVACCEDCSEDLLPTDEIRLVIERGGKAIIKQKTTWNRVQADDGYYTITLTKDEAKRLDCGLYTWRVQLVRRGEILHTLVASTLEVIL